MQITESKYNKIQEEFRLWFAESGADREYDSNREQMEFDFISRELGTDEWEMIGDFKVTNSITEYVHHNSNGSKNLTRVALTTYHNPTDGQITRLEQKHYKGKYSKKNKRFYVYTQIASIQLTVDQWENQVSYD